MKIYSRVSILIITFFILSVSVQAQQSKKDVLKEFSFWLNASGAAADLISSAIVIDGVKVIEGNPILARNGRVAWERAIPIKALVVYLPTLYYEKKPVAARVVMWISGGVQWFIAIRNAFIKQHSFQVQPRTAQVRWSITF